MMECVDAFQEFLEQKCEEGHGSAEIDMFSNLANVTAVGRTTLLLLSRLSSLTVCLTNLARTSSQPPSSASLGI